MNAIMLNNSALLAMAIGLFPAGASLAETADELLARATWFETVEIDAPQDLPGLFTVELPINGEAQQIRLERVSVWAPGAVVKVYGADGTFDEIAPPPDNTYRGTIPAYPGAWVTGAILDDGLHAVIRIPGRSALEVVPIDGTGAHALIDAIDRVAEPMACEEPDPDQPEPEIAAVPRPDRLTPPTIQLHGPGGEETATAAAVELAIEADVEYYSGRGSTNATLSQMAAVVNSLNPTYETDASLTHILTTAVIRTAEPDPYSSTDGFTLNSQQVAEWTANQTHHSYDVVMLFTGKDTCSSANPPGCNLVGRANVIGSVCNRNQAFCFTEYHSSLTTHAQIAGHELGHLWNGRHCDSDTSSPCFGVTPCKLMCGTINGCDNNDDVDFAACNAGEVAAYRQNQSCFTGGPEALVWVDWFTCDPPFCVEFGLFDLPYNTVAEGVAVSPAAGFVMIKSGLSSQSPDESFPLTIDRQVELRSFDGSATIGG